jgi:hypothetical protein
MLGVVIASFFFAYANAGGGSEINLKGKNGEWVFPIDAVETMGVPGPLGETLIEIRGGTARIAASPCPNQACVAAGAIHSPGQWAACLPNQVMLYISENRNERDVDAAAW